MATVAEIVVKAAYGEVTGASKAVKDLGDVSEDTAAKASKIGTALGIGITAVIGTLAVMTKNAIDNADAVDELSQRLLISTEALSGWAYGAKFAGVAQEELAGAITKLNSKMDDVYTGGKAATETFERLGVKVTDAGGKMRSTEDVFLDIADAFTGLEDNASKSAIAAEIFGKQVGPALVPYLSEGREGIEELNKEALRFGLIISKDTAAAAGQFNDSIDRMKGAAGGMGQQLAAGLLPTINNLSEVLLDTVNSGNAMSTMAAVLGAALKSLGSIVVGVGAVISALQKSMITALEVQDLILDGQFGNAWERYKEGWVQWGDVGTAAMKDFNKIWSEGGAQVVETAKKTGEDVKRNALPALEDTPKKLKETTKKELKETEDLWTKYKQGLPYVLDPMLKIKEEIIRLNAAIAGGDPDAEMLMAQRTKLFEQMGKFYQDLITKNAKLRTETKDANDEELQDIQRKVEAWLKYGDATLEVKAQIAEVETLAAQFPQYADRWVEVLLKLDEKLLDLNDTTKLVKDDQSELMKDLVQAAEGYGQRMSDAFIEWTAGSTMNVRDMVRNMIMELAKLLAYQSIFKPLTAGITSWFSSLFADGDVFRNGAPQAFANGLINSPTYFPMANGNIGLAGESGAEAIVPLRRDANGRLGISGGGGGGVNVGTINVNIGQAKAEDAPAISKAAQEGIDRAMRGLVQSEIFGQMRTGNALNPYPLKAF